MEATKHVLIVDDEPTTRKFLEVFLRKHFNVSLCNDGLQAMNWLNSGNLTHAILADLNMPNMDGLEFIKQIRNDNRYDMVGLIVLSGNEKSADKIKCLDLGADDYVVKPFNPDEIRARITNIFRRINKQQA